MRIPSIALAAAAALVLTTLTPTTADAAPLTVIVSASGAGIAGTSAALGDFDLLLEFDPAFTVQTVSFGTQLNLGDPAASLQFSDTSVPGSLSAFEISFVDFAVLNSSQSDSFVILSILLEVGSAGPADAFASIRFSSIILGNAIGDRLSSTTLGLSSPDITSVPEPATLLLAVPCIGMWWRRSARQTRDGRSKR